jgi:hypothetical protein
LRFKTEITAIQLKLQKRVDELEEEKIQFKNQELRETGEGSLL